jgi:hypothetical protein
VAARFDVVAQWRVGSYRIDIVVQDGLNRLAVECDGDRYHTQENLADDISRQLILERLGWRFHRIRGTAFYRNPDEAMDVLFNRLDEKGIRPVADVILSNPTDENEEVTSRLIRRAAEIRQQWHADEEDDGEVPEVIDAPEDGPSEINEVSESSTGHEVEADSGDAAPDVDAQLELFGEDPAESDDSPSEANAPLLTDEHSSDEARLLTILKTEPGLKAKELGHRLGLDRRYVNSLLHGRLGDVVTKDEAHGWWIVADL